MNLKAALLAVFVMIAGVMTSCDKSMNDPVILPEKSDKFDQKELSTLRSSSSLGNFEFSPEAGSANETQFFFELTSTEPLMANEQVRLYVIFYPPQGGTVRVQMNKLVFGSTVRAVLYRNLQQVGTYKFKCGFSVNGGDVVPFTDEESIIVTSLGDDYDSSNDSWYANRYCTAWVAWKVNQMWGERNAFPSGLGWARDWKNNLENYGYEINTTPRVGSIAWWPVLGNCTDGGTPCGHVAFVSKIENDEVYITEYNGRNPRAYGDLKLSERATYPSYFIHVQQRR